ncbi:MAG: glutaminyl-peptide cyclotransferase [Phycisphaeraceae bacterium]|nr:glutaminyl-peptide cyclotransferase [Phycisphaeraceae bacterium]
MKRVLLASLIPILLCSCTKDAPTGTPVYGYRVINTYPHEASSFTQGLVIEQGQLYESTGNYGESHIFKVDLESGRIQKRCGSLPGKQWGEGITILNNRLYHLTYRSHHGYVYDLETFDVVRTFQYPAEGWGLTHDGTHLIMSNGSATLTYLDPNTLEPVGTMDVLDDKTPVRDLNELEYIEGRIYANLWLSDRIAIIKPDTGKVEAFIDLTGLRIRHPRGDVLNGIAYDSETKRLYVTGKWWSEMYEIEIVKE